VYQMDGWRVGLTCLMLSTQHLVVGFVLGWPMWVALALFILQAGIMTLGVVWNEDILFDFHLHRLREFILLYRDRRWGDPPREVQVAVEANVNLDQQWTVFRSYNSSEHMALLNCYVIIPRKIAENRDNIDKEKKIRPETVATIATLANLEEKLKNHRYIETRLYTAAWVFCSAGKMMLYLALMCGAAWCVRWCSSTAVGSAVEIVENQNDKKVRAKVVGSRLGKRLLAEHEAKQKLKRTKPEGK
jgi:hypothetical protein